MLIEIIKRDMDKALRRGDKENRLTLSLLMGALYNKQKEEHSHLKIMTEAQEIEVLMKEIKQTKETLELTPKDRVDIISLTTARLSLLESYAPAQMSESQIRMTINQVLDSIGVVTLTSKEKGLLMKHLIPKTKGKADGKLVNRIVEEMMV